MAYSHLLMQQFAINRPKKCDSNPLAVCSLEQSTVQRGSSPKATAAGRGGDIGLKAAVRMHEVGVGESASEPDTREGKNETTLGLDPACTYLTRLHMGSCLEPIRRGPARLGLAVCATLLFCVCVFLFFLIIAASIPTPYMCLRHLNLPLRHPFTKLNSLMEPLTPEPWANSVQRSLRWPSTMHKRLCPSRGDDFSSPRHRPLFPACLSIRMK